MGNGGDMGSRTGLFHCINHCSRLEPCMFDIPWRLVLFSSKLIRALVVFLLVALVDRRRRGGGNETSQTNVAHNGQRETTVLETLSGHRHDSLGDVSKIQVIGIAVRYLASITFPGGVASDAGKPISSYLEGFLLAASVAPMMLSELSPPFQDAQE